MKRNEEYENSLVNSVHAENEEEEDRDEAQIKKYQNDSFGHQKMVSFEDFLHLPQSFSTISLSIAISVEMMRYIDANASRKSEKENPKTIFGLRNDRHDMENMCLMTENRSCIRQTNRYS